MRLKMDKKSKYIERKLKYVNGSFPSIEWNDFLKNCNINFRTSRKDRLWYSIRGKGFLIWISSFYPSKENDRTIWLSDIEMNKNAPQDGVDAFNELIQGALAKFDKMELI